MLVTLDVGAPAHGGYCVARHRGRVVFVRHALPGERVRARITEDGGGAYCRADAVEILEAASGRQQAPCPAARPGGCGGCDWQHASAELQRRMKGQVVREQFRRLAGLDVSGLFDDAEELPGGMLGWRTRITFAVGPGGLPGLHRHRSDHVEHIRSCPLGVPGVGDSSVLTRRWEGLTAVEVVAGTGGEVATLAHRPGHGRQARGRRPPDLVEVVEGPGRIHHQVGERVFQTAADGFWQVHPHAASALVAALRDCVAPAPGDTVLDLYCGAGALTAALAEAVGPTGRVVGVDSSARAVLDGTDNLRDMPWVQLRRAKVAPAVLAGLDLAPDVVVLDPPRAGAGREVMAEILAMDPRVIGYVACDPATLARDIRVAVDAGWQLAGLRVLDAFPMTHHVECIATLAPGQMAHAAAGPRRG